MNYLSGEAIKGNGSGDFTFEMNATGLLEEKLNGIKTILQ